MSEIDALVSALNRNTDETSENTKQIVRLREEFEKLRATAPVTHPPRAPATGHPVVDAGLGLAQIIASAAAENAREEREAREERRAARKEKRR